MLAEAKPIILLRWATMPLKKFLIYIKREKINISSIIFKINIRVSRCGSSNFTKMYSYGTK